MKSFLAAIICMAFFAGCDHESLPEQSINKQNVVGIMGGDVVVSSDPLVESTVYIYQDSDTSGCTGTLVSQDLVLTSAHCVSSTERKALRISYGSQIARANETLKVAGLIVHPHFLEALSFVLDVPQSVADQFPGMSKAERSERINRIWDGFRDWGDIAILKLESAPPKELKPAKLWPLPSPPGSGTTVLAAGYGITKPPQELTGLEELREPKLLKANLRLVEPSFALTEALLAPQKGQFMCHGDSGGPAFVSVNEELYLWGILSRRFDDPEGTCKSKYIYTSIQPFRDWIVGAAHSLGGHLTE